MPGAALAAAFANDFAAIHPAVHPEQRLRLRDRGPAALLGARLLLGVLAARRGPGRCGRVRR